MRLACRIGLLIVVGVSAMSSAADIQVFCEPDLGVFLDGKFAGASSARDDGFVLMNVGRGRHTIRIEKDGFVAQSFEVDVARIPLEIQVEEFTREPLQPTATETVEKEVERLAGSLLVTSVPQNCIVEIDGEPENKSTPQLSIGGLAAGEHRIVFSKAGYESITELVTIQPGSEVLVRGNLKDGKVEVVHQGKGSLRVMSTPTSCTIRFRGKILDKTGSRLNLGQIPAGEYPITVSISGREMSTRVLIRDQTRTVLEVSFVKGQEPISVSYVPK